MVSHVTRVVVVVVVVKTGFSKSETLNCVRFHLAVADMSCRLIFYQQFNSWCCFVCFTVCIVLSALSPDTNINIILCFSALCPSRIMAQPNMTSLLAPQADRVMALGEWEDYWLEGKTGFHQQQVNK